MVNINKYRQMSSYNKLKCENVEDFIKETVINQAIEEFDIYLKYSPNSKDIYVNDSDVPIKGTLQDMSDLEVTSDSKWLLTSVKTPVYKGDIITIKNKKWICTYDKEKNTENCFKVKIQPCTYVVKLPFYDINNGITPIVYDAHSIVSTYLTDTKDFKQPFPTETGTTFVTLQYNEYTKQLLADRRVWLYERAYKIGGVDFTNVNFYTGKGYIKLTMRPDTNSRDLDNFDLGICDYYLFFNKDSSTIEQSTSGLLLTTFSKNVNTNNKVRITATNVPNGDKVLFTFSGDNLNCTLVSISDTECILQTSNNIGIIYVTGTLLSNASVSNTIRIMIGN